ncbi:MAG: polysaccharide pyruvyl transferase family protein [Clostridia bacterium]|nr:polysaccharide pyruvyl transferase family protein [Clostridia bacterium]
MSERLKKDFPDCHVEIIDYMPKKEKKKIYINVLRTVKHEGVSGGIRDLKKICAFRRSYKHLSLSKHIPYNKDLNCLYSYINQNYDMLIIGSDAVFNWNQNGYPTEFIPDYKFNIPVVSYAASVHGLKFFDEAKERITQCERTFDSMSYIGVRDRTTADFVKFCSPQSEPVHCCDPTFIIDKEKLEVHARKIESNFPIKEKYIVIMAPDSTLAKSIAQKYKDKYKIVAVFKNSKYADQFLYNLDPFEWANVLKNASCVITSYFHGTLLSLVQGTPVIALDYSSYTSEQYEGKLRDLMVSRLALPELFYEGEYANEFSEDVLFWNTFDALLSGSYSDRINSAVEKEKAEFEQFSKQISNILQIK